MFRLRFRHWEFSPGWLASIVTLLLLTLLINLGLWQMRRAEYKTALVERYQSRSESHQQSIDLLLAMDHNSMDFPVAVTGTYLHAKSFLLDNRTHQGKPGFQLLTPLDIGNYYVLINRGWIAQGKTRNELPTYSKPQGLVQLEGITFVPNPNLFVLEEDLYDSVKWPYIIQKIELDKIASLLNKPLAPFTIRLNAVPESGFIRQWQQHHMTAEKHYGYALQWFSLALALSVIYISVNTKKTNKNKEKALIS